jgi:hypothetical protein
MEHLQASYGPPGAKRREASSVHLNGRFALESPVIRKYSIADAEVNQRLVRRMGAVVPRFYLM